MFRTRARHEIAAHSVREHTTRRNRLTWHLPGQRRITRRTRKLTDQERAEVVKQMRAEGRLGPEVG
jgi:hypothetical protein